uniref:Bm1427 n=1 Tax=Brugia malayi TaxID=6279 RepID=A0A1I9GD79_BRUMA|nr:Bm1427 [Brugia malayi]
MNEFLHTIQNNHFDSREVSLRNNGLVLSQRGSYLVAIYKRKKTKVRNDSESS